MTERHKNAGIRKLCKCSRKSWSKCGHPWHFNFKWAGEVYRFSLERTVNRLVKDEGGKWRRDRATLGDLIESKSDAERERDRLRTAIRNGTIQRGDEDRAQRDTLTMRELLDSYRAQYIAVHRAGTMKHTDYQIRTILRTELDRLDGSRRPFGQWLVSDVTTDVIEAFRRERLPAGVVGTNRDLALLRALFNWATSSKRKLAAENPFVDGATAAVRLARETQRRRRLQPGEGDRLLAACGPHLRALVEAAIETGCRRGELLSLQWWQVRFEPKAELFLPAQKTKTKADRTIPISTRLRAILEMRRNGPEGSELPPSAHVFGNELGEPVKNFKRAWQATVLRAHGYRPQYVVKLEGEGDQQRKVRTALLTRESQLALRAIDLHFHDLRREAGSRWLDAGVPLHRIQKWLGHANISQTSIYLMADSADDSEAMKRFEAWQARLQRIATESETGHQNPPQSATVADNNPRFSTEKHH